MANITRFRPDPILSIITAAVLTSFASGIGVGMLATMPAIAQPARVAQVEPCHLADAIACLITEADEEVDEPPQ